MKKVDLSQFDLKENFVELSEECQLAVDGGCGSASGGTIVGKSRIRLKDYFNYYFGW